MELIARFGRALNILSWFIGGLLLLIMIWGNLTGTLTTPDQWLAGVVGGVILVIGRSIQFVLSGY